jgi:L-ascorbate metabolism protein UlaG (beta-lactamase superfamily)
MEFGNVELDFLGHSGFRIRIKNGSEKIIFIDPYNLDENAGKEKADIILISHSHYDHCSIKDIEMIRKEGSIVICPADVQSKITRIENLRMELIEAGDELSLNGLKIEAVPAYNTNSEREFHTKKDGWVGFIIKYGNVIIYHSGDSDRTREMERLSGYGKQGNTFIALLPVSGKYVMNADEAVEVAKIINPTIAIPMHYGSGVAGTIEDAERFVKLCKENGVNAAVLDRV